MRILYHHVQWYRVTINDLNENEPQTRPRNCQSRECRTDTPGVIRHEDYIGRQFYCSRIQQKDDAKHDIMLQQFLNVEIFSNQKSKGKTLSPLMLPCSK